MTQTQSSRRKPRVAEKAALVVRSVRRARDPRGPVVDPARGGIYDLDCSELVSNMLRESAPEHYARIPKDAHLPYPGALEFADYFESLAFDEGNGWHRRREIDDALVYEAFQGWRRVERLAEVRRGDVIAWKFAHAAPGADTGHVLLVADEPVTARAGVTAVRVLGSRRSSGSEDSETARESFERGMVLWSRTLLFHVSRSGAPSAVQFVPSGRFHALPIVIGRLEPLAP